MFEFKVINEFLFLVWRNHINLYLKLILRQNLLIQVK